MKNKMIILVLLFFSINGFSCPKIKGILIDACSLREEVNEWMVLTTNTSIAINNLKIDYDVNNNGGIVNADIGGSCSWQTPRTSSIDSLKVNTIYNYNIIPVSPGSTIPANSTILVLTSDSMNFSYNITNLTQYGNVYVIQSSCKRTLGAFTNLGNGVKYRLTKISYNLCRDSIWHYIGNTAINGQYGVRTRDTMAVSYGNIFTSFCDEYIILPIELSSFIVDCNKIEFVTESESNIKMFYIESSFDTKHWFTIDSLLPKNYYNIPTTYSIINNNLGHYYRLKVIEYDKINYSDIYYNKCDILENKSNLKYKIYTILGQEIDENNLSKGVYIKLYENGKTTKIIK